MAKAAIEIPDDYLAGLRRCADTEKGDLSAFVIQAMLENYEAAKEDRRAMCGDTGVPRWYVKFGNEARIEGGPVGARGGAAPRDRERHPRACRCAPTACIRSGAPTTTTMSASTRRRSNTPSTPTPTGSTSPPCTRAGCSAPTTAMLFPGDGIDGIKRFYLDTLIAFGKRGLACQPAIVGVGLGGSKDICMVLGKQASCLRVVGSRNPDPKIAALEDELKELGNNIGMGAMGFMGSSMVVDCHIEVGYCHTGGMPMWVHMFCLSSRRATARVIPTAAPSSAPTPNGSPTTCAARPWSGSARWPRRRSDCDGGSQDRPARAAGARREDLRALEIGSVVYLTGRVFTAREGVYKRAVEDGAGMPAPREALGLANFHCSPAAAVNADGSYTVGAVTATASFRFAKWLDGWFELSGCNIIIGKGGMTSEIYRKSFVPKEAIYLTTVGYGTGALLGPRHQAGGRASTGSRSSALPRRCGCSRSRISGPSWSRATSTATRCSSARTPRSRRASSGSTRAPGRRPCAGMARPTTRPKS